MYVCGDCLCERIALRTVKKKNQKLNLELLIYKNMHVWTNLTEPKLVSKINGAT